MYTLLVGGSSSGKTFINIKSLITRAYAVKSRHVAFRKTFNSIKRSIWYETLPDVLRICFPGFIKGVHYDLNKADWFLQLKNGSMIWFAGLDDKDRLDKILGSRYSTIFISEVSEVNYHQVETIKTRLGENSGLPLKMFFDANPPSIKHWTYKVFFEGINPEDGKSLSDKELLKYAKLIMNPVDNKVNLPSEYFGILDGLSKRKRDRFRDGLFASDVEGALWSNDMINLAQLAPGEEWVTNPLQTIVAVDPNVAEDLAPGEDFTADECGIGVISKDIKSRGPEGLGQVEADYSGEYSTTQWAEKAVEAYHKWDADCLVYEKNQGGALVKNAIRAVKGGEAIQLKPVWSSKGKFARAEPVTVLYEQEKIKHKPGLDKLEAELLEYVPSKVKKSPNRLDWLVHGATYLFLGAKQQSIPMARVL
jgi:phage terminase large subunit-like protein